MTARREGADPDPSRPEPDQDPSWMGAGPRHDLDEDEIVERQAQPGANEDV